MKTLGGIPKVNRTMVISSAVSQELDVSDVKITGFEFKIMNLTSIKIPLYKLNYVSTIDDINSDQNFLTQFNSEYKVDERKNIFEQLDWAIGNPDYNFSSLVTSDRFTDEEIYDYIQRLHKFILKNKAF